MFAKHKKLTKSHCPIQFNNFIFRISHPILISIQPHQPDEIPSRLQSNSNRSESPISDMEKTTTKSHHNTVILTYGTLKQGFSNHGLMQDLIRSNDASYIGPYTTCERYPLVTGPYKVPFLLNIPGRGERVCGELYAVSRQGLARLDELEGTTKGHYERRPITVIPCDDDDDGGERVIELVSAEAYFAHGSYAMGLWRKSGERGYGVYSEKESIGYVRRVDRPKNLSFLQQIQAFVGE